LEEKKNRHIVTGLVRPTATVPRPSGLRWRPAEQLLRPGRLAQPTVEKGGRVGPCQPGAAGTNGGAVVDSGSAALAVEGQWHENRGRLGCTRDMEGRVDSH
jgi:hypothetical protein